MISDDEIVDMERSARRFAGAYTGTSGSLAGFVIRLIQDRRVQTSALDAGIATQQEGRVDMLPSMADKRSWTPVHRELPPLGVDVLLCVAAERRIVIGSLERAPSGEWHWESDSDEIAASPLAHVSHWLPLPPLA